MSDELYRGLPKNLPPHPGLDPNVDHAPIRKQILTPSEERWHCRMLFDTLTMKHHSGFERISGRITNIRPNLHASVPAKFQHTCTLNSRLSSHIDASSWYHAHDDNNLDPRVAQFRMN